jgi:hypothetical protein
MSVAVSNPENYCPICGCHFAHESNHRCHPNILTAIDTARPRNYLQVRKPTIADRFTDGFRVAEMEDDVDDELAQVCSVQDGAIMLHWF